MQTFESFNDLEKSDKFGDKMIHNYVIRLLDCLFGKHDNIIIDSDCETEKNQQLIHDQDQILIIYFRIPEKMFSKQNCVCQILKHIVDHLNTRYQFKQPLRLISIKETILEGSNFFAKNYMTLNLV